MDVVKNIEAIRKEKGISQEYIASFLGKDNSVLSNIKSYKRELKVNELEIIANALDVNVIYLLTYPDVWEKKTEAKQEPVEAILQIKLQSDKKEQVLRLVFGDNNLEILNR